SDYYPFGMEMPGRHTNEGAYRFGYNGMELDNEAKGNGNSYTTEFRQYDPRLGRWLSLDPLMAEFPWMSPYVAFDNNPVYYTDPLGLAAKGGPGDPPTATKIVRTTTKITKADHEQMQRLVKEAQDIINEKKPEPSPSPTKALMRRIPVVGTAIVVMELLEVSERDMLKIAYGALQYYETQTSPTEDDEEQAKKVLRGLKAAKVTVKNSSDQIEIFTNNPSTLSDDYMSGVRWRIQNGKARASDWQYAKEAYARSDKSFKDAHEGKVLRQETIVTFTQGRGEFAKKISVTLPDGYKKTNYKSHGQNMYHNKKTGSYITPDQDGHNGGVWKKASSVENLGSKETREGTYNEELEKVGD
ncbi:toxin C-terminal domain-containing protein, partial [Fluviicola sp.]|uniref:toxin C-terminal domain-containing protein n=1 Tax=Fluviicola sp. TaxID=1917219 RepID=UPI002622776B